MRLCVPLVLGAFVAACHRDAAAVVASEPPPRPAVEPPPAPVHALPMVASHELRLRRDSTEADFYGRCSVIDTSTNQVVGRATAENTAAGGTVVECIDLAANGKVMIFANSRGHYARDARLGKSNNQPLPCGEGVYANDVSSCVELDLSHFYWSSDSDAPSPFELRMVDIASGQAKTLATIPTGLNRYGAELQMKARWWDARYCENDRLLVLANGAISLYEAPSGKRLSTATVPKISRLTSESCQKYSESPPSR